MAGRLDGRSAGWQVGWMTGRLDGRSVGWQVGWMAGRPGSRSAGRENNELCRPFVVVVLVYRSQPQLPHRFKDGIAEGSKCPLHFTRLAHICGLRGRQPVR